MMRLILPVLFALLTFQQVCAADLSTGSVKLDANSVTINGKRTILLIGSFQYFRIDPSDWNRWLNMFEDSGYNTIDCYVPWNFHEPVEGDYDFTSPTHDLPLFLKLCHEHHLYVFLRGGPYICSEWDGGGIPAWTIPKEHFKLRTDNQAYLDCIRPYLHQLDAVIKPFLITNGGPIILDQIENEHDYFDDPPEDTLKYITILHDIAHADGINVPITACVGAPLGGADAVRKATGLADGVMPTGNFYVSGNIEADASNFVSLLHQQSFSGGGSMADLPALCTETDRDLNVQRRLLAGGLKGIAPFLFVGGNNYMFNSGDTNWASPVAFIASSYDFGGMVSFSGVKTDRWYEARRFAGAVNSVSSEMASASSDTNWDGKFNVSSAEIGAQEDQNKPPRVYRLANDKGSSFIFLWNEHKEPVSTTVTVDGITFPRHSTLTVAPTYDQIVPVNLPLAEWGMPGVILRYSTNEFYHVSTDGDTTTLILTGAAGSQGEISFSSAPTKAFSAGVMQQFKDNGDWTAVYTVDAKSNFGLIFGEHHLHVQFESIEDLSAPAAPDKPNADLIAESVWRNGAPPRAASRPITLGPDPQPFELNGIIHGAGMYQISFNRTMTMQPGYYPQGNYPQGYRPPGPTPPGYRPQGTYPQGYRPPGMNTPPGMEPGPYSPATPEQPNPQTTMPQDQESPRYFTKGDSSKELSWKEIQPGQASSGQPETTGSLTQNAEPGPYQQGYNPAQLPPGDRPPSNYPQGTGPQGYYPGNPYQQGINQAPPETPQILVIPNSGDIVTVTLNGICLGTKINGGNEVKFDATKALINGPNDLMVRAEIWGHANFDDNAHPSTVMNSTRGIWGSVTLGGTALTDSSGWTLTAEETSPTPNTAQANSQFTLGQNGEGSWSSRLFTLPENLTPDGYLLKVEGKDVLLHVFVNGHPTGRFLFGPAANPHITGGPDDLLYVPAVWLNNGVLANTIDIYSLPTSENATITTMQMIAQ